MRIFHGIAVSPGVAMGEVFRIDKGEAALPRYWLHDREISDELSRFTEALDQSKDQISRLKEKLSSVKGREHGLILEGHLAMLDDVNLKKDTLDTVQREKINAEWALHKTEKLIMEAFSKIDEEYFRERRHDVGQVIDRIQKNLSGNVDDHILKLDHPVIIVAHDLSPIDLAHMPRNHILGFATDVGGRTSHTGIVAASMEIPAVVGAEDISNFAASGDFMIVDGIHGVLISNPTPEIIQEYQEIRQAYLKTQEDLAGERNLPAETIDHHAIHLSANMELLEEIPFIQNQGAKSIGLFRTEFFFLDEKKFPSEDEQFRYYSEILKRFAPHPVTMRTFDVGGDKTPHLMQDRGESNPALGLRAIRYLLKNPEILKTQLRAMIRASAHGHLRIMFPLISDVEELKAAKRIAAEVTAELKQKKIKIRDAIQIGIMIETPSAVLISDLLAPEVDFFCVGTNDLIQYTLAADRVNESVAYLYNPLHPAILRMLEQVVLTARHYQKPIHLCGEMASDPLFLPVLLALGFNELSMNAVVIPRVKHILRLLSFDDCELIHQDLKRFTSAHEALERLKSFMVEKFPNEFDFEPRQ